MREPSHDPSIDNEPHLQATPSLDPKQPELVGNSFFNAHDFGKNRIEAPLNANPQAEGVDHTVWDEPTHVANPLAEEAPEGEITYSRWIDEGIKNTAWIETWSLTVMLVLAAGPWGIVGAFVSATFAEGALGWGGILSTGILAPVTEEITKVAALLWVVEKRPYWFKSLWQILICAIAGGVFFAVIENLIYTNFYVPDGSDAFNSWRWTVCTGLHVNCSFIAGIGLVRIWDNAIRNRKRPELGLGMPFFTIAMVGHGLYNIGVSIAQVSGWLTFD